MAPVASPDWHWHQRQALMTRATRLRFQPGSSSCPYTTKGCDLFPQCRVSGRTGRVQLLEGSEHTAFRHTPAPRLSLARLAELSTHPQPISRCLPSWPLILGHWCPHSLGRPWGFFLPFLLSRQGCSREPQKRDRLSPCCPRGRGLRGSEDLQSGLRRNWQARHPAP